MLTPAPFIPPNLDKKLEAAIKPFQREYDSLTMGDARRLLGRHGFRMPVICSLVFHGNGALQRINIRENLKRTESTAQQFEGNLTIFSSPYGGVQDLRSPCLRWIAEDTAKQHLEQGWHQNEKLSDATIEWLLRSISNYGPHAHMNIEDVSMLMLRRMAEHEREVRTTESNHARCKRLARPVPSGLMEGLSEEREAAFRWRDDEIGQGYTSFSWWCQSWPEEERVILAFRKHCYSVSSH